MTSLSSNNNIGQFTALRKRTNISTCLKKLATHLGHNYFFRHSRTFQQDQFVQIKTDITDNKATAGEDMIIKWLVIIQLPGQVYHYWYGRWEQASECLFIMEDQCLETAKTFKYLNLEEKIYLLKYLKIKIVENQYFEAQKSENRWQSKIQKT